MNAIHQRTPARTDRPLRLLSTLGVGLLLVGSGLSRPALGQNLIASDVDQQRHLRTVWSERATGFLEAWTAAEEAERAVGAEALELLRHSSAPKGVWPALPELSGALRVMRGESLDDVRTDPFVRQIDGVDLEVAPGVFPAVLAEEQAPLAVRVYSTGGPRPVLPVELRLTWIAPDGWRMTARRTVVEPRAWIAPGFEVFVIPPGNTPGLWHLEPSILLEGRTLRGQPVPVECVERWDERLTALRGARDARPGSLEPGLALLLYHLELLVSHGLRLPGGLAPSQALALLEAGVRRGPVQAGAPFRVMFRGSLRGHGARGAGRPPRLRSACCSCPVGVRRTRRTCSSVRRLRAGSRWRSRSRR